jgi:hypothetical protein
MNIYVGIVERDTGDVVKRIENSSHRRAEKVESGLEINLNHDEFYTRTVEE